MQLGDDWPESIDRTEPTGHTPAPVDNARVATHVRAARAHDVPERPPLRVVLGQLVQVGERDTVWPEFVFVTADDGSGWVPARHLSADSGSARVEADYDTAELPTSAGDVLRVVREDRQSGWLWCRGPSGREGWVPISTLVEDPP